MISRKTLQSIKVLYREPDSLSLWGIPYQMRPNQSPRNLANHPNRGWIWLGCPGWWGSLSKKEQTIIAAFTAYVQKAGALPENPHEWVDLSTVD